MKDSPIARAVRRWENKHYIMDANDIELLIKSLHNTIQREARKVKRAIKEHAGFEPYSVYDVVYLTDKLTKGDR